MLPKINLTLVFVLLTLTFGWQLSASAQHSTTHDNEVRTFHGRGHQPSGRHPDKADLHRDGHEIAISWV